MHPVLHNAYRDARSSDLLRDAERWRIRAAARPRRAPAQAPVRHRHLSVGWRATVASWARSS